MDINASDWELSHIYQKLWNKLENSENFMTSALSKATLLEEKEELPDKLLEQIQNNDIAFVELMLV